MTEHEQALRARLNHTRESYDTLAEEIRSHQEDMQALQKSHLETRFDLLVDSGFVAKRSWKAMPAFTLHDKVTLHSDIEDGGLPEEWRGMPDTRVIAIQGNISFSTVSGCIELSLPKDQAAEFLQRAGIKKVDLTELHGAEIVAHGKLHQAKESIRKFQEWLPDLIPAPAKSVATGRMNAMKGE